MGRRGGRDAERGGKVWCGAMGAGWGGVQERGVDVSSGNPPHTQYVYTRYLPTNTLAHMHAHIHMLMSKHKDRQAGANTHTHTNTCMHTRTHTHSQIFDMRNVLRGPGSLEMILVLWLLAG